MRTNFKLAFLLSSLVASTMLFAQSTSPGQTGTKGAKPAQVAQSPAGGQAAGAAAGQTGLEAAAPGILVPSVVAAGVVAVGAATAAGGPDNTPTPPKH